MSPTTTALYLIRHAHAGQRASDGRDIYRPLSHRGTIEADRLTMGLQSARIDIILSSPATRCVQTVQPLAQARSLEVVEVQNLWEDCLPREMLTVMEACADSGNIAICSHGNLIPEVIEILAKQVGIKVIGRGCEKGSVWELERTDGAWQLARYLGTFKK